MKRHPGHATGHLGVPEWSHILGEENECGGGGGGGGGGVREGFCVEEVSVGNRLFRLIAAETVLKRYRLEDTCLSERFIVVSSFGCC